MKLAKTIADTILITFSFLSSLLNSFFINAPPKLQMHPLGLKMHPLKRLCTPYT